MAGAVSMAATRWAWPLQVRPPTAKLVLLALADHADRDGYCWPSVDRLAELVELDAGNVRRHLGALEAAGLVAKVRRARRADGTLGGLLYRLDLADQRALARGGTSARQRARPAREAPRETPGDQRAPARARNLIREPSIRTATNLSRRRGPDVENNGAATDRAAARQQVRAIRAELRDGKGKR
jgi:DNA-binding transcriptional ArsR family regulator